MPSETDSHIISSTRQAPYRLLRPILALVVGSALLWSLLGSIGRLDGPGTALAASDPVIGAAGDIACDPADASFNSGVGTSNHCRQKATSDLLVNSGVAAVLDLGDNQYYCASLAAFQQSYDLSWGRLKSITRPAPGNHEYLTSGGTGCDSSNAGAAGYFNYFGSAAGTPGQGYYSYDIGAWHIIALNSNCTNIGGCGSSSAQYRWLQSDLQSHSNFCTLAYWHIPLFSSGGRQAANSQAFWNLLYQYNADVILNGHDHLYERFAPQTPAGASDPVSGLRQFTVGTGGNNHTSISTIAANSEVRNASTFGVIKLALHSTSYDWQFVPEAGKTFTDSGTGNCHGSAAAISTPVAASPTPTLTGARSLTFLPQADSYVNSGSPTTNYGTLTSLRADASPIINSYIRYAVSGLNGASITRARLLLHISSGSSSTLQALRVSDNSWGETTVNYNNAPPLGSFIGSTGGLVTGAWVAINVSSYITGEGTYSFGVNTPGLTAVGFASRELTGSAPELILDLGGSATATATPTLAPATPSRTPTATGAAPTATPTSTSIAATATPTSTVAAPTATPTNTPAVATATPTSASQSVTFVPNADSYVDSSFPATNYGTLTQLRVDGSPIVNSYVRFSVSGLNGASIQRARLLFYMNTGSSAGLQALAVTDNTWGETAITYSSAPPMGNAIGTSGGVTGGTWATIDVTSYMTGEGTYSFGVITPGSTAISLASRESGAHAPQLIIDLGP